MSKLLKIPMVGLPETKNQQGRTFNETCWVHICIKNVKKFAKVIMRKVVTSRKKVRLIIDNAKKTTFSL